MGDYASRKKGTSSGTAVEGAPGIESAALSGGTGFTLSDLRQLHKAGKMTDREFELAKAKILEAAKRASERQASPLRAAVRRRELRA